MRQAMLCTTMLLGLLMWASHADAHLMPAQQGALHVQGPSVLAMVALPVSALNRVDDDGDGRLSDLEVQRHLARIKDQVQASFRIFNGDTPGRLDQLQVLAEEDERTPPPASPATPFGLSAGAPYFLMLMKVSFASPPDSLHLAVDFFGTAPRERQLTLDMAGFEAAMDVQRQQARAASRFEAQEALALGAAAETCFEGYESLTGQSTVLGLFADGNSVPLRAWNHCNCVRVELLPAMNISGFPSKPSPTT